jgi:hypothetical protein
MIASGSRGVTLDDLSNAVPGLLSDGERTRIGSINLHVAAVCNDLKAVGELMPLDGSYPERLVRAWRDAAA